MPCATVTALLNGTPFTSAPVSNFRDGDTVVLGLSSLFGQRGTVIMKADFPSDPGKVHVQLTEPSWNGYIARNVPEYEVDLLLGVAR